MRVTSHTEDNDISINIKLGGSGLATKVASTSSHKIWVSRLVTIIRRGNVDLAIRTTMGAAWE